MIINYEFKLVYFTLYTIIIYQENKMNFDWFRKVWKWMDGIEVGKKS